MPYCGDVCALLLLLPPVSIADIYSSSSSFESELKLGCDCKEGALDPLVGACTASVDPILCPVGEVSILLAACMDEGPSKVI